MFTVHAQCPHSTFTESRQQSAVYQWPHRFTHYSDYLTPQNQQYLLYDNYVMILYAIKLMAKVQSCHPQWIGHCQKFACLTIHRHLHIKSINIAWLTICASRSPIV